ncbi:MAG: MoaD/ThiS family protein [Bacteroidetes bacterium]|mgnify:CR=1 FL=1|jgi:molybdopterin converting factor small subunit|nr:MoaD/ThiS family protein [Bacteroidota bacterium]
MNIYVMFFGVLAEVANTGSKHYRNIKSFSDLKYRVEDDFPEFIHYYYRIAVNNVIVHEEPEIKEGDRVIFLPPFAGG